MPLIGVHRITKGDTLDPLNAVLRYGNGDPIDLSAFTMKFRMETDAGVEELAETATGVTAHPTQTFTAASAGLATCNSHGVKEGDQIVVATSGTLPSGLAASTRYFAVNVTPNAFGLATVPGGQTVIAGAGTGTHTFYVVGSIQMEFLAAQVDTAGTFRGWFVRESGADQWTHPEGDSWYEIRVVEAGA
jgi:hypothetical protein